MLRSLYTSALSLMSHNKAMDVSANNIANANTTAYKEDKVIYEAFPDVLTSRINDYHSTSNPSNQVGKLHLGSGIGEIHTNYSQGQIVKTENPFDFCIENSPNSFFAVGVINSDGNMEEYFTRDGSFTLDRNNNLITRAGDYVLDTNGSPIHINDSKVSVDKSGNLLNSESDSNIKLKITTFEDTTALQKLGSNLIKKADDIETTNFTGVVRQGALESSNVNSVKEMIKMVSVMRSYETSQKIVQIIDSTLEKGVNEVGRQ